MSADCRDSLTNSEEAALLNFNATVQEVDRKSAVGEELGPQEWKLAVVSNHLDSNQFAEPIDKALERLELNFLAIGQNDLSCGSLLQPQAGNK